MGFFGGLIFVPGIFVGFVGSPRDFFGFLIFAPIRSSPSLQIRNTPPPPGSCAHNGNEWCQKYNARAVIVCYLMLLF